MQFSTNGVKWTGWTTYATSKRMKLTAGDGQKTVFVRFMDSKGAGSNIYAANITLDTKAPTKGTMTITPSSGTFVLNWQGFNDATTGIANYVLVMGTKSSPSCTATPIYEGTNTQYVQTGIVSGTTYYYRVCAVDNAGKMSAGATAKLKAP